MRPLGQDDPRQVGPFRITGVLGGGGMGRVYLGRSAEGRAVAVKTVRSELADDPHFRRRFGREVTAARRVRSPFVAQVVAAEPQDPAPWMATEYLPGLSLADAVREHGPLPERTVHLLVAGLVRALAAVHAYDLVHRDVKPSNVLLTAEGPRLIDFGIAHSAADTALTNTGMALGTPGFMAPEQLMSVGPPVSGATDVFSLGGLVVHALTGAGPYGSAEPQVLMYRTVHEEPHLGGMDGPLRQLAVDCLTKDPGQRPSPAALVERTGEPGSYDGWLPAPLTTELLRLSTRVLHEAAGDGGEASDPPPAPAPPPSTPIPFDALPTGTAPANTPPLPGPPGPPPAQAPATPTTVPRDPAAQDPSAQPPAADPPPTDATPRFVPRERPASGPAVTPVAPPPGPPPAPAPGPPPASAPGSGSGSRGLSRRNALVTLGVAAVAGGGGVLAWALGSSGDDGGAAASDEGAGTDRGSSPDPRNGGESPGASADPTAPTEQRLQEALPAEIRERGSLRVAATLTYEPLGFMRDGEPVGAEVELMRALGRRFGLPVTFEEGDYETLRRMVQAGDADIAVSAQHDTRDGQADFDYVDYFQDGFSLVVPKGNPQNIRGATDLLGKPVTMVSGSVDEEEYLRGLGGPGSGSGSVEIVAVTSWDEMVRRVARKRASAFLQRYSGAVGLVANYEGGGTLEVAASDFDDPALYGIVLPQGRSRLRTALRDGLADLVSDGTYATILRRWKVGDGALDGVTVNAGK